MKLSFREIEPFVAAPNPAARVILIYGPDDGLMRERAKRIGQSVVPDLTDPFNVAILNANSLDDDPSRLMDEAYAISMMGGDRVIRIENAADFLTPLIKSYLEKPNERALVILEAGELGTKSSLRALCEKAKNAAALPCYVEDEKDLGRLIRETIQASNLRIDNDAVSWLAANISGNRMKVRSELEKIILYKGAEPGAISLKDVMEICGAAAAQSLDDLIYGAAGGNPQAALKAFQILTDEGMADIAMLRALQNHFRKLHLTKARLQEGDSLEVILKTMSPPIFFKQEPLFRAQVQRWSLPNLERILFRLADLEAQTKQTGAPVETLCAQAILSISAVR
jgi:DNA polymerase-3 subunit delta